MQSSLSANIPARQANFLGENIFHHVDAWQDASCDARTMIGNRLKRYLDERGMSQTRLAEEAGLSRGYLSSLVTGNAKKQPTLDVVARLAEALQVRRSLLIEPPAYLPVVGRVGAGAEVDLVDAYAKGDGLYGIEAPDALSDGGYVAVEVSGDSMEPLIQNGDVLLFARQVVGVPDEAVGRVCVLATNDGRALVKQIKQGREPRTWDLHSANHTSDPMWGVRLEWAAPVRFHLPEADVRRMERPA